MRCRCSRCARCVPALHPLQTTAHQVLQYEGERLKGRYTAARHFHDLMRGVAGLGGDVVLAVESLEHRAAEGQQVGDAGACPWAGAGGGVGGWG